MILMPKYGVAAFSSTEWNEVLDCAGEPSRKVGRRSAWRRLRGARTAPVHSAEREEAVVAVEGDGLFVLRVDQHGDGGDLRGRRPLHGVSQQRAAEPSPPVTCVDRQAAQPGCRHRRVAGKFAGDRLGSSVSSTALMASV